MRKSKICVFENENLKPFSTMGISHRSRFFIIVYNLENLKDALEFCMKKALSYIFISYGANTAFIEDYNGVVIVNRINDIKFINDYVIAQSGAIINNIIKFGHENNLCGMENLYNIPGSIGAGIVGNIGSYGDEVCNFLDSVELLNLKTLHLDRKTASEIKFSYRNSSLKGSDYFLVSASFKLNHCENIKKYRKRCNELVLIRKEKIQQKSSCGSFFKNININGKTVAVGRLIDELGLKGFRVGDFGVSELHGNIIVHYGNGKGKDLLKLKDIITKKIRQKYNYDIETEVRLVGKNGYLN